MKFERYRDRLAKHIIVSNVILFVLILVLYISKGFTDEEITELLKYILPIKALYLTAVIKFSIAQQQRPATNVSTGAVVLPLYKSLCQYFIYSHIVLLYLIIILTAFNALSFDVMINLLVVIETFFGIYIGLIIDDIFGTQRAQA